MDTNILSTFGKVERLDLLASLFEGMTIGISESVCNEIRHAEEKGHAFCRDIIELVDAGKIKVLSPTPDEARTAGSLPGSFGLGERDSVAMAIARKAVFVTNEKKVRNYCERRGVDVLTLGQLLRALWELRKMTKKEVKALMGNMERKDNLIITSKKEILDD